MGLFSGLREMVDIIPPNDGVDLIVSQNPDQFIDACFLRKYGIHSERRIPAAVHFHWQWNYLDSDQQRNATLALKNAHVGIVPATFLKKDMKKCFRKIEWKVVPNGVDPMRFFPATQQERTDLRDKYEINLDTILVCVVGRLTDWKGLRVLHEVAKIARDENIAFIVQYPAWGSDRKKMERRAAKLKKVAPDQIFPYPDTQPFASCRPVRYVDAYLTPSLSEVQPYVVLEALMSGVPVVATKSTPFYDELERVLNCRESIEVIPLPERFISGQVSKSRKELTGREIRTLSQKIVKALKSLKSPDDDSRKNLARLMKNGDFTLTKMNNKLLRIYEEISNFHSSKV